MKTVKLSKSSRGLYHAELVENGIQIDWKGILSENNVDEEFKKMILDWYAIPGFRSPPSDIAKINGFNWQKYNAILKRNVSTINDEYHFIVEHNEGTGVSYWSIVFDGHKLPNGKFVWILRGDVIKAVKEVSEDTS